MERLFLYDAASQSSHSYADLIADLNNGDQIIPDYVYSNNLYEVFKSYILAILFEEQITLLDHDFSKEEIEQLLPYEASLTSTKSRRLNPAIRDVEDFLGRLRGSKNAEIGFFTSGTTGLPKRVDHKLSTLARSVKLSESHSDSVWGFAYNPTHIAGCQVFLQAILNGSSLVNIFGVARSNVFEALSKFEVSHISATPTFYRMLIPVETCFPTVRRVTFGGEKMDPNLAQKLKGMFPKAKFLNVYASTEAGTILAADGEVFSIKAGLTDLVKVEANQLFVHAELLGDFGENRDDAVVWYPTGDIVEIVSEEPLRFKIEHRANDLINVGGYKVNPTEVEDALRLLTGIQETRVYAQKNSILGNLVCCDVVVADSEITERVIRQYLAKELQSFKIPRMINFVESLEKTRTGKLKRA